MFNKLINRYLFEYSNATETAPPPTREKPSPTRKPSTSPTRTPSPIWAPSPGRKAQPKAGSEAIHSENEENYENNEYVKAAMSKFKHRGP